MENLIYGHYQRIRLFYKSLIHTHLFRA